MDIRKKQIRTIYPSDPSIINSSVTNFANLYSDTLYFKTSENTYSELGSSLVERFINDFLTTSRLPSYNKTTYDWNTFREDLEFLNLKLSTLRKTITSWDTYHIAEVATNRSLLVSKLATLAPNTGLLINITPSVEINGVTYGQGDVVYCDFNGEKHHIPGSSGGYYFPQDISSVTGANNTFKLKYRFATALPSPGTSEMKDDATPSEIMNKTIAVDTGNTIYFGSYFMTGGQKKEITLVKNDAGTVVYPIVRLYLRNATNSEEMLYDDTWVTYGTDQVTVENKTKLDLWLEIR